MLVLYNILSKNTSEQNVNFLEIINKTINNPENKKITDNFLSAIYGSFNTSVCEKYELVFIIVFYV